MLVDVVGNVGMSWALVWLVVLVHLYHLVRTNHMMCPDCFALRRCKEDQHLSVIDRRVLLYTNGSSTQGPPGPETPSGRTASC